MKDEKGELLSIAERVRTACLEAAQQGYERGKISSLCHEGAWKAAVDDMGPVGQEALIQR